MEEQQKKKKRKKIHEVDLETDIRYRGPLSDRSFKILGWLCLALSQIVMLFNLVSGIAPAGTVPSQFTLTILSFFASLSVPFLVFATFSKILNSVREYKNQLLINGVATLGIIAFYMFVYYHYLMGLTNVFHMDRREFSSALHYFVSGYLRGGSLSFNIFIDLFLCTLFMFFLNYDPKRFFKGKKLLAFRMLAILPILYEAASLVLKYLASNKTLALSPIIFPFLTTKPPMLLLVFLVLAIFVKNRERRFCKHGRTKTEYHQFLHSKRNSWQFSVFAAIVFFVAGILDLMILMIMIILIIPRVEVLNNPAALTALIQEVGHLGIGSSVVLIPVAPLILLFSYNRTHKNHSIDLLIPTVGVAVIVLIYLEFLYQVITQIPSFLGL